MTPRRIIVTEQSRIILNQQCDNNSTEVLFLQDDPALLACTWTLLHQRPGDSEPYLVPLAKQDGGVLWTVSATDCATAGRGRAQLICTSTDGSVMRSRLYTTIIAVSMGAAGDVPATMTPYVDQIAGYAAAAEAAVEFVKEQTFAKSVNGLTPDSDGNVDLSAEDVGARPNTWTPTAAEVGAATVEDIGAAALNKNAWVSGNKITNLLLVDLDDPGSPTNRSGFFDETAIGVPSSNVAFGIRYVHFVQAGFVTVEARCYITDNDSAVFVNTYNRNVGKWIGWQQVYTSHYKPTAAEIGARPDTWVPTADEVGALSTAGGSVGTIKIKTAGTKETCDIVFSRPDDYEYDAHIDILNNNLRIYRYDRSNTIATVLSLGLADGALTVGGGSLTPTMSAGTEYKLGERWMGNPVYAKLVDFGALPNSTYKSVSTGVGASKIISVYGFGYNATDGAFMHFPTVHGGAIGAACFVNSSGGLVVETYRDMSAWVGKFIVKYTK